MGFKDKMTKHFSDAYIQKYGDRMTSANGTVLSVKIEEKSFLGIIRSIAVSLVLKPDQGKQIIKCAYRKKRWFKKPEFIDIKPGHKLIIMGLSGEKGKEHSEVIIASNIANLTTKKDLQPFDHSQLKKARQQATKMKAR
ncbi:hypothetical protein [Clostridium gasigenes]|uniref:Uncharacterized protein n=1 Tax=Clostridium gasigenes TaxID=94869 RepID=A0A1H0TV31_9CLOT|nr:hypothetical protein [Clostridium gasigenes]MBB6624262.1 hypothetical protein [Clostridium gasigenes]MBU3089283.1 hypothetical protein [Clostridium gasigenes]MBU3105278.1 hypothetical protein [Clostridium gasigenes]MBU3109411.1 hypothetical protein [Clostridium gasigenes]MBU3132108.1 hypothetical protein [Clostridium gasigenes]